MREQKENRAGFGASKLINWDSATVQPNFVVTHAYDRDLLDEVTLRVGDKLFVAEVWPDGWCLGENLDSIEYFKVHARAAHNGDMCSGKCAAFARIARAIIGGARCTCTSAFEPTRCLAKEGSEHVLSA